TMIQHLAMNTTTLIRLPQTPRNVSLKSQGSRPVFQPPRKSRMAMPLTATIAPYSPMKKNIQRMPLYSVWKPATSSLSASARSNGARLHCDVAQQAYSQNATKVNGSWNMYQFQNIPPCCLVVSLRFIVPA